MTDEQVVKRWAVTGLLVNVAPENLVTVARRLDAAADLSVSVGVVKDLDFIEDEILKIRAEGLFGT